MNKILFMAILLATSACNSDLQGNVQPGHFQGSLIQRNNGKLVEVAVQADLSSDDNKNWQLDVQDTSGKPLDSETFSVDGKKAEIAIPSIKLADTKLVSTATDSQMDECFSGGKDLQIQLCQASGALLIEIADKTGITYSISLQEFPADKPPTMETPKAYSLDDAMKVTLSSSFRTRAEFEKVMESALATKNAYLNLLPRLNINSGVSAAKSITGGFLELLGVVGDLAPFLLPTRWIAAKSASIQTDAEKLSLLVVRGDAGNEVESMFYSYKKDGDILDDYKQVVGEAQKLADQIRGLESLGAYPLGTADTVQTSVNGMNSDFTNLSASWGGEKASISQAMGFVNPDAVSEITIGTEAAQPELDTIDESALETLVLQRSLEIAQIDELIKIAQNQKKGTFFQFLDPSGDPNASLGAATASSFEINQDHVIDLMNQKTALQASTIQNAQSALGNYNTAKRLAVLAASDLTLQQNRVNQVLETMNFGKGTNTLTLVTVYQDLLKSMINSRTAQAAIQVSRAKLNRLMLEGYYAQLGFTPDPKNP